jgi:hypothetical protein
MHRNTHVAVHACNEMQRHLDFVFWLDLAGVGQIDKFLGHDIDGGVAGPGKENDLCRRRADDWLNLHKWITNAMEYFALNTTL